MTQKFNLISGKQCKELLSRTPSDYKVFWRAGFGWKGAGEVEDDRLPHEEYVWQERRKRVLSFDERMQRRFDWAAAIDVEIDYDKKEIHFNGFSANDMY